MASKFEIDMEKWAKQAEVKVETYAKEFMNDIGKVQVESTLVDTGFLMGSWDAYINDPSAKATGRYDPSGSISVASISLTVNGVKIGDTVYFLNSAEYAAHLEFGTQYISPRAFVRGTLAQAPRIAKATAERIRRMKDV